MLIDMINFHVVVDSDKMNFVWKDVVIGLALVCIACFLGYFVHRRLSRRNSNGRFITNNSLLIPTDIAINYY